MSDQDFDQNKVRAAIYVALVEGPDWMMPAEASRAADKLAPRVVAAIRAASNDNWPEDAALAALRGEHP